MVNNCKINRANFHLFCFLEFRNRSRVILIATDVAARGLGR
jgi:hypothetical protein